MLAIGVVTLSVAPVRADAPSCVWEIEYDLAANLKLTETSMGQGDGVYPVGPGKAVLRYDDQNGRPGRTVEMTKYAMREKVAIKARAVFWSAAVDIETRTAAEPGPCAVAAKGAVDASGTLRWSTPVRGYHTDGTLTCTGSVCGKFGAPAPGVTRLRIGAHPVWFSPFVFSPDGKTFTMATTHVSKTSLPKQSGEIALAGREVRRACVPVPRCGG